MLHDNLAKNRNLDSSSPMSQIEITIDRKGENQDVESKRRCPKEDEPVVILPTRCNIYLRVNASSRDRAKFDTLTSLSIDNS